MFLLEAPIGSSIQVGTMWKSILAIAFGAALGALLRWQLGARFNSLFPTIPPETLADLRMLLTRADSLEQLHQWPEGEAAARRVLLRLLEGRGWEWAPFANAPARPPARRADWGRPWTSR